MNNSRVNKGLQPDLNIRNAGDIPFSRSFTRSSEFSKFFRNRCKIFRRIYYSRHIYPKNERC
jgi:hypothetical protein